MNKRQKKKQLKKKIEKELDLNLYDEDDETDSSDVNGRFNEFLSFSRPRVNKHGAGITDLIFNDGTIVNISSGQFVTVFDPNRFNQTDLEIDDISGAHS